MSTAIAPSPVPPSPPSRPAPTARHTTRAATVVLAVVVVVALALTVLAGLAALLVVRGTGSTAATEVVDSSTIAEPADEATAAAAAATAAAPVLSNEQVAADFAAAWTAGDFDAMSLVATDSVVETVRQSRLAGSVVSVTGSINDNGGGFMVMDGSDGPALLFAYTFDRSGETVRIGSLVPAGDAG